MIYGISYHVKHAEAFVAVNHEKRSQNVIPLFFQRMPGLLGGSNEDDFAGNYLSKEGKKVIGKKMPPGLRKLILQKPGDYGEKEDLVPSTDSGS